MKISKPACLELMVRPYRWRGQSRIGLTVIVAVDSSTGQAVLNTDQQLWDVATQNFETGGVIDLGIPKVYPEYLVSGYAYTQHQVDKARCLVGVQVNDKQKELYIIGDRYSLNGKISAPQPFEMMPLSWAQAYGGEGDPNNPLGKGRHGTVINGVRAHLMPNIEWPQQLITDIKAQNILAAGFGAQDITWPVRYAKVGNYSKEWLQQDFPGFLPDMDPTIFNAAMPDQVWQDAHHFPSEVEFAVSNMHPTIPIWRESIPMFTGRCIVQLQAQHETQARYEDVSLKLKTLWLVPHLQTYFLIYQDSIAALDDDGDEIKHVLAGLEWTYSAKSFAHYQDYMQAREDHEESALLVDDERRLLPENISIKGEEVRAEPHSIMWQKQEKFKTYVRHQAQLNLSTVGLDLNDFVPEFVGPAAPLNLQTLLEKQTLINQRSLELRNQREALIQAKKRYKLSQGKDTEFLSLLNAEALKEKILDPSQQANAPTSLQLSPAMQSLLSAQQVSSGYAQPHAQPQAQQQAQPQAQQQGQQQAQPHAQPQAQQHVKRLQQSLVLSAHLREQAPTLDLTLSQRLRQEVLQQATRSKDRQVDETEYVTSLNTGTSGQNYESADLSGLCLEDLDFSLSSLAHMNAKGTQFIRCRFENSAFSFAQLHGAQFIDCQFIQSNLNQTDWQGCKFTQCHFENLMTHTVRFENCLFDNVLMDALVWQDCELIQSQFIECRLEGCAWQAGKLSDVLFKACYLHKAAFSETSLTRVQWLETPLYRAAFAHCEWQSLTFQSCELEAIAIIAEQAIRQTQFLSCKISSASLRQLHLIACDFTLTQLINSDLSKSHFEQCSLRQVDMPEAVLRRCVFDTVDFTQANLMLATFSRSIFRACIFVQTNFYASDFSMTDVDAQTLERGNYMKNVQLEPSLREPLR